MKSKKLIKSKWVDGAEPDAALTTIAALALRSRLHVVSHYVPLAAKHADEETEYVHQLRVATRRAIAAIQVFRTLLPNKRSKRLKKQLATLRRASGAARDLDVLLERLQSLKSPTSSELKAVVKDVRGRRRQAQMSLLDVWEQLEHHKFETMIHDVLSRVRWRRDDPEPSFAAAAPLPLTNAVERLFQSAAADLHDPACLHKMRVAGKRLRYTMELLATAFPPSFKNELYPIFGDVQDRLGSINDHATAARLFNAWADQNNGNAATYRTLAIEASELAQVEGHDFRHWWTVDRVADLQSRFDRLLADE